MLRKSWILLLLLIPVVSTAQPGNKIRKGNSAGQLVSDTALQQLKKNIDSVNAVLKDLENQRLKQEYQPPAFDPAPLLELQKEMKARQKRQAMIRIAIGLGFLAILVVGLTRQRRKKRDDNPLG